LNALNAKKAFCLILCQRHVKTQVLLKRKSQRKWELMLRR